MEVLRQCPFAIAQWLVRWAIAVLSAVLGQSHKDNVCCTAVEEQLEGKEVQLSQPMLHLPTHDLFWANLKAQLHLPPLDLLIFWSRLEPWPLKHYLTCVLLCHSPDSGPCCTDTCTFKSADSEVCQDESECKMQAKCKYPFALSSQSV